ncbi:hypothetical protein ACSBR1_012205 [Camellia fascicularis]
MALQTGVSTSKVLILVGAGLTGSVILRSGQLSDLISQLQELIKGVNEVEISPDKYDSALLAAQIRQLAQEIRELTVARPITIFNGNSNSTSSGSATSYLLPAAALGAMGYCYMWWKGWSLSDVMFVTKHNMANAVATVSKQLEHVSEALASTKRHLMKRLENLDWKLDEQKETSKLIANDVSEVKSNLNQIGYDIEIINQMVSGLEGKIELLESKQDTTNSGLWYLCQLAGGMKDGLSTKPFQDVGAKLTDHSTLTYGANSLKGLQFIAESEDPSAIEESTLNTNKKIDASDSPAKSVSTIKTRIHRSYPVGMSLTRDILGPYVGMSSSSNYFSSAETLDLRYEALKCDYGLRAAIRVTESDKPSKGRLYVICEKRNCQFWRWCTPKSVTMVERQRNDRMIYQNQNIEIVGLKVKNQMLEQSLKLMKQLVVGLLTICIVILLFSPKIVRFRHESMALLTGVSTSKVLIIVGAGLTGSVILRSGQLSDLILQLQELIKGVNEVEISPDKYDSALLAAQIQQLAQEIRELTVARPIAIFNGNSNSTSSGSATSYLLPAAALGAMGYCYMWWKGWSLSDVMFVTKHNMANAVATVSKQLEHVPEALASKKRHLTKRLENLNWKLDEQKETSKLIANDVDNIFSSSGK